MPHPSRRRPSASRAALAALAAMPLAACGPRLEPRATPTPGTPSTPPPAAAAARTPAFAYAAGRGSYLVVSRAIIEVSDDSAAGRDSVETVARVRVEIAPGGGDAARLLAVVDSFTVRSAGRVPTAPLPLPVRLEGEVRGGRVTLGPAAPRPGSDAPGPTASDDCASPAGVVLGTVRDLFPALPARLTPGTRWADTVATATCRGGVQLVTTAVHRYTVAGEAERQGRAAVRVERASDVTVRGEGEQARVRVATEGRGSGRGTLWVDVAAGRLLEADTDATLELTFTADGGRRPQRVVQRSTQTIR